MGYQETTNTLGAWKPEGAGHWSRVGGTLPAGEGMCKGRGLGKNKGGLNRRECDRGQIHVKLSTSLSYLVKAFLKHLCNLTLHPAWGGYCRDSASRPERRGWAGKTLDQGQEPDRSCRCPCSTGSATGASGGLGPRYWGGNGVSPQNQVLEGGQQQGSKRDQ